MLAFLITLIVLLISPAMPVHAETRIYTWYTDEIIIKLPDGVSKEKIELSNGTRFYTPKTYMIEEILVKARMIPEEDKIRDIDDFMATLNQPYISRRIKDREWREIFKITKYVREGALYFFDDNRLIQISYKVYVFSDMGKSLDTIEVVDIPMMKLKDPNCSGDKYCTCIGNNGVSIRGELQLWGVELERFANEGVDCLSADFDGNGFDDFIIAGGEGWVSAHFMGPKGWMKAVHFDPGGFYPSQIYPTRSSVGPRNEPVTKHPGIKFDDRRVYLWDGSQFVKHRLK